jgi:hypothetical protein
MAMKRMLGRPSAENPKFETLNTKLKQRRSFMGGVIDERKEPASGWSALGYEI